MYVYGHLVYLQMGFDLAGLVYMSKNSSGDYE